MTTTFDPTDEGFVVDGRIMDQGDERGSVSKHLIKQRTLGQEAVPRVVGKMHITIKECARRSWYRKVG